MDKRYSDGKSYKVIALVCAMFYNEESARIIRRFSEQCLKYNCRVVCFSTLSDLFIYDSSDIGEGTIFDYITVSRFDAIVVMGDTLKNDDLLEQLINSTYRQQVPVFCVDKEFDHCINMKFEYGDAFKKIVEHMVVDHGYKKINLIAGIPNNRFSDERIRVFRDVLIANGIEFDDRRVYYGYFWEQPTVEAVNKMLEDGIEDTEAIICANDTMAITAMNILKAKGYKIPQDIAITGFDGIELTNYCIPSMTTSDNNLEDLIAQICSIISGGQISDYYSKSVPIMNTIRFGRSCGCSHVKADISSEEMMALKIDLVGETKYQILMNKMATRINDIDDLNEIINTVAYYLDALSFENIWICANNRLRTLYTGIEKRSQIRSGDFRAIHFSHSKDKDNNMYKVFNLDSVEDLIPDLDSELDRNTVLMVLPVRIGSNPGGYLVCSFLPEKFKSYGFVSFLNNLSMALEIKGNKLEQKRLSFTDPLTGLNNRESFFKKADMLLLNDPELEMATIALNVEGVRLINENYGHNEGDNVLRIFSRAIRETLGPNDLAARVYGDQFIICFTGSEVESRAERIADMIKTRVNELNVNSEKYSLRASVGIFCNKIRDHDIDYFVKRADDLMLAQKNLYKKYSY